MSKRHSPNDEQAFWLAAKQRLLMTDLEQPIGVGQVDELMASLPAKRPGETVGDWIRRVSAELGLARPVSVAPESGAVVPHKRLQPLAQIVRLAADSGDQQYPLPDPGWSFESADGRWRVEIQADDEDIVLVFQALGFAADDFANRRVFFSGAADQEPFAVVELDSDGDGSCRLADQVEIRKALVEPYVLLEEPA